MVERRKELDARYTRKKKMNKLKAKLTAPGADRAAIIAKIKRISPWWTEAALAQRDAAGATAEAGAPAADEAKKKAPAKAKPKA